MMAVSAWAGFRHGQAASPWGVHSLPKGQTSIWCEVQMWA